MSLRRLQSVQRLGIAMLACCMGCNVLAPLEDPLPQRIAPPVVMQEPQPEADSGVEPPPPPPEEAPSCAPQPGVACDPVARCGCSSDLQCELDDAGWDKGVTPKIACLPAKTAGEKKLDDVCRYTTECEPGLSCAVTGLCARYCKTTADCGSDAICLTYVSDRADAAAGTGACARHCDPSTRDACGSHTECRPASDTSTWSHAVCYGQRDSAPPNGLEGARCSGSDDCAHDLDCARFGPEICTRYCVEPSDCPPERPLCHFLDQRVDDHKPIGQCMAACDETSVPATDAWPDGPVWTQEQLAACEQTCAGAAGCIEMFCPDSQRYQACLQETRRRIASSPGRACRAEHVAQVCCSVGERSVFERIFLSCADDRSEYTSEAQQSCVSGL